MTKSRFSIIISLIFFQLILGQNAEIDSLLDNDKFQEAYVKIEKMYTDDSDNSQFLYYSGKLFRVKEEYLTALDFFKKIDSTKIINPYKAYYFNELANTYRYLNLEERAFNLKIKAQKSFEELEKFNAANEMNYDIHYLLSSQKFLDYDGILYLDLYFKNAELLGNKNQLLKANLARGLSLFPNINSFDFFSKAREYVSKIKSPAAYYRYYNYMSALPIYESEIRLKYCDSALIYAKKLQSVEKMESSYKNFAQTYREMKNYRKAISFLLKADTLPVKKHFNNRKQLLYKYLAQDYDSIRDTMNAYKYLKLQNQFDNKINYLNDQNQLLLVLATKDIEKKNAVLAKENIIKNILLIVTLVTLSLVSLIAFFINRNLKRKKLLIEKEEALKAARIESILKEQEIQNIDARYEGREKERKRIAEDLHDDLGAILSTIKLYFQNMKIRKDRIQKEEEKLMKKANELLDEAYQKVRNIAHLKDAASNLSEGLVASIINFANKVSQSENLPVQVLTHGLNTPLDPELENDLRRITIELITNAMNHAKATEISIDINSDDKTLSIVVEDDGKGFDTSKIDKKKDLGLYGIQKKVESMQGKIIIDTNKRSGTTIIIEIPVKQ